MDGKDLDREIESLLSVEPSPEFLARVRARVAAEPKPGRWRAPWMLAFSAATAAVVVGVIVGPSPAVNPSGTAPNERPQISEVIETITPAGLSVASPTRTKPARALTVAAAAAPERAIEIDLPAVMVAENEMKTFATLVASIRQSRFDVAVPVAPDPDVPLEVKILPPVEPLEIEPIVKLATLQTEGERP